MGRFGIGDKSLTTTHVLSLALTQVSSIEPPNYPGWAKATLATVALVATATILHCIVEGVERLTIALRGP